MSSSPNGVVPDAYIRRATMADVPAIEGVTRAAYGPWLPLTHHKPLPMIADYERAVSMDLVDVIDGRTGLVALVHYEIASNECFIASIAVDPEFHARGYGRRLLAHAEATASSGGVERIRLYTNKVMTSNIAWYLRAGYAIDGEQNIDGRIAVHMSKALS
jgi:ribosomal protein S18 acetylase RimI-like enzyme